MPSQRTIAEIAQVSIMTVSRALRDDPHVHPDTRKRIRELAELYHYRPNRLNQGLLTGNNTAIGCLLPTIGSPYYDIVMRGIVEEAFTESFHVIILQTHFEPTHTLQALHTLIEQRVNGILIAPGHKNPISPKTLLELWSHNITPVLIDLHEANSSYDQVMTDEKALAEMAVNYLVGLGHRRIAYVGAAEGDKIASRYSFIRAALQHHGLSTEYFFMPMIDREEELDGMLEQIVNMPNPPTALLARHDLIAARLLHGVMKRGLRVPQDISVMGCGNLIFSNIVSPQLTTIEQFPDKVGHSAATLLFQRIRDERPPAEIHHETVLVPPKLIERQSCARPRRP
ncbi:MAG TPA: LacI family DNA-binding transcriptional regulator [Armatimonadota bacterium]